MRLSAFAGVNKNQCGQPAGYIDHAVENRGRATGYKALVILVEQCVDDDERRADQKPAMTNRGTWRRAKRARRKESEDGVLSEVRNLSRDEMNNGERLRARVWKQPEN